MTPRWRVLALIVTTSLLLDAWSTFGPFLIWPGPYHWSVTPVNATLGFGYGVLWTAVISLTYWKSPSSRMWKLMLVKGVADGTWVFGYFEGPVGTTIAEFFGPLGAAILLHIVLAFPGGRLTDRVDRALIGLAYVIVLPIQLLGFLTLPADWNVIFLWQHDELNAVISRIGLVSPVVAVLAITELLRHWYRASPAARRALTPMAIGMPPVFVILGIWWLAPAIDRDDIRQFMLINRYFDIPTVMMPLLFLAGTIRARLARGTAADLAEAVARGVPLGGLEPLLARTLRDPTLRLGFPAPTRQGLVDVAGREFALPTAGRGRVRVDHEGELLAVVDYDKALDTEDPGLVEAAASVVRMTLENERLSAQVRAQLDEVRASRDRVAAAEDAGREGVEGVLRDGAEQRLAALIGRLEAARGTTTEASALIDVASAELGSAIDEIRWAGRGLPPSQVERPGDRRPDSIESGA